MFKNYLKIAFRTLSKYKGYALINIFGLAVGLASAILIMLFVQDELSYDKHHENAERIYRVGLKGRIKKDDLKTAVTCYPMASTLKEEYPMVETSTRLQPREDALFKIDDRQYMEKYMLYADSTVFDVFTMPFIQGDPATALNEPNKVVLTRAAAEKYFGNENPVGKVIEWVDGNEQLEVTGIIEDCKNNSHFQYNVLVSFTTSSRANSQLWIGNNVYTYLKLQKDESPGKLTEQFSSLVEKYVGPQIEQAMGVSMEEFRNQGNEWGYFLQPLTKIYLHSDLNNELGKTGNINYVYFFSVIALFLILIAAINFMNLSTAKSANRAKEVGIRKVTGSNRSQLIGQFLSEAILISFIALGVALIFVKLALPTFNNLANKSLYLNLWENPLFLLGIIFFGLVVGLLSGSYPAFYLSKFAPSTVLKGKLSSGSKNSRLRGLLVIFQFVITIILIISTLVVSQQMNFVNNKDLGFNKDQVMVINRTTSLNNQAEAFRQEILKIPGVKHASYSLHVPGTIESNTAFYEEGSSAQQTVVLDYTGTDCYFDETYGLGMAAGRFFSEDYSTDSLCVVINEAAARKLNFEDPVGKKLYVVNPSEEDQPYKILGVAKDFNYASLHHKIRPLVMLYVNQYPANMSVQLSLSQLDQTLAQLKSRWNEFVPGQPFQYSFLKNDWEAKYRQEQRTGTIFRIFSILAIFIACLGLLGLASFMAEQRTKEIGVRKVFGASVTSIMGILSKEVVILIGISTLVAWPAAYYFMNGWLRDFAYRIELSLLTFIVASLAAFGIALLTIGHRAYKSAVANPAESLKDE